MESRLLQIFYERYSREIYLYIYSMCHDRYLAEDLTQETFTKAFLSLADGQQNARAWAYKVARNLCLNELRKRKQQDTVGALVNDEGEEVVRSPEICAAVGDIEDGFLTNERDAMLYAAINRLSETKREIVYLQYFSDFSQREIARLLSLTPENVRVLAHRAKKEMKEYLLEAGYEIS